MKIICDFDGTIVPVDTTDAILERFALPEWLEVEQEWVDGKISSAECMSRQVDMIRADLKELNDFIDSKFTIADGFAEFLDFAREQGWDVVIVSDGIDYVAKRVMANHNFGDIPLMSNHLNFEENGRYRLSFPYKTQECGQGVCKCRIAECSDGVVLVGDGRSDFCLAGKADLVLAKRGSSMEKHCLEKKYQYLVFNDFYDVTESLNAALLDNKLVA